MKRSIAVMHAGLLGVGLWLGLSTSVAGASDAEPTFTRAQATGIVANFRKIASPEGVEEQLEIPVGGTQQWITVRGRDRANPILLLVHGGPASPETPMSWAFQSGWEDYFTVVQWDQRGSGKTYNANNPDQIKPTLSLDRFVDDAGEVVQYLRERYGKQKIFVLGHSWGSLVGISLAHEHPEWLYAYIGMGQVINGPEAERVGYEWVLQVAEKAGNAQAVKELESIAPYPEKDGRVPLEKINVQRKWSVFYGGLTRGRSDLDFYYDMGKLSPDYTQADLLAIDKGSQLSLLPLLPYIVANYSNMSDFETAIVLFEGRYDFTTPSAVAADWLTHVKAPVKKIVWFEKSAHMMPVEEPGRLLVHLVQDVLPLAAIDASSRTEGR
jgi:pimeloyl-ACP methyl ester carboxylesterase